MTVTTRPVAAATTTITTNQAYRTVITRTEMCGPVFLDTDTIRMFDFPINPACDGLFPWLSRIAPAFDMYDFNYLRFRYVPSCGTTTVGSIVMAIDYDPVDPNAGLQQADLVAMAGSVSSQLYSPCQMAFNRSAIQQTTHKFFVSSDDSYKTDARFDHIGRFIFMINATPTVKTTYGQLYVDYSVTFHNPQNIGPGYSNNGTITNTTKGSTSENLFGTVDQANVKANKPDATASVAKTKRIVKIIDGIANVVAKVAPYVSLVAKLFLLDYAPPLAGTFHLTFGDVDVPLAIADIPGENVVVLHSSQCRSGTIFAHAYGTYTTLVNGSRPVLTIAHSTNITLTYVVQLPTYLDTAYVPATPRLATATAVAEFDFNDLSVETAWIKPVVMQSGSADIPVWSVDTTKFNVYTKADI